MYLSYIKIFPVVYFLCIHGTQGRPPWPIDPDVEQSLTKSTTSIRQDYEERVKPAMERLVDARLAVAKTIWTEDPLYLDLVILPTATPEQRAKILAAFDARYRETMGQDSTDKVSHDRAAGLKARYEYLLASAGDRARFVHANGYKSRIELRTWILGVELMAREAERIVSEIESVEQSVGWSGGTDLADQSSDMSSGFESTSNVDESISNDNQLPSR